MASRDELLFDAASFRLHLVHQHHLGSRAH
jgi:hypothetical protein